MDLAAGLARRGHLVTLLAASGSRVRGVRGVDLGVDASRFAPADLAGRSPRADEDAQRDAFGRVRRWLDDHRDGIDIVHAHAYDAPAFDALRGLRPVVHTLHLPPGDPAIVAAASRAAEGGATLASVSAANVAAWTAAGATIGEILPNGIDVDAVPFGPARGGPLLFAARISPEKGPEIAIRAAERAGRDLLLAGAIYDPRHFDAQVRPRLGRRARYLGAVPRAELYRLMASAAALLAPVRWDEPFGLTVLEAQAAGAPVVAFARGGIPEIVIDGRTGWLVAADDEEAFVAAVRRIDTIDRSACRENAKRSTLDRMIRAHERLYVRLGASGSSVSLRS